MKKLLLGLVAALLLYLAFWFIRDTFFHPPRTFVKMYEGSASVYYVFDTGEKEYLGILYPGENITALPMDRGPFSIFNLAQIFVPKATAIFKTTIAKLSIDKPMGVYDRIFTEDEFDHFITSKIKKSWIPDSKVILREDGFTATATLTLGSFRIPIYAGGIVGVDKKHHGTMYVSFKDAGIGKLHFPRFFLNMLADASNKLMGRGTFTLEILDMVYVYRGIKITYRKTDPFAKGIEDTDDMFSTPTFIDHLEGLVKKVAASTK